MPEWKLSFSLVKSFTNRDTLLLATLRYVIILDHKTIIIKGYFLLLQFMAANILMKLAEDGNLIGDMKIHQDPEVSERDLEDLIESSVDNQEAIEYFFTDIKDSLDISFALHQAKLIIAAESNFKDLLDPSSQTLILIP